MKAQILICGLLLPALATAGAQVASHAPTMVETAPAQSAAMNSAPANKPVALVNGSTLTSSDLLREEYAIFPYARQHGGLPKELASQIRDGAMKMLVFEELVYQEATRRHMTVPPAKMQRAESDFRRTFPTPDAFNAFLQGEFQGSQKLLDEKIRRSLLIEAFLRIEVENKCVITPADLRAYYDNNAARFQHPETYTFQTISVLPPANATPEQLQEGRKRAEQELPQAKATKTAEQFGMLAEKLSDDDYRVVMGQHKPAPVDQLAPPVVSALRSMHPGDVSGLIQLDQAYTIVRLNEHKPAGKTPLLEVRAQLSKELQQTRRNQLRAALDKSLRENAKVEEF
jgi:PPIC-type PPIASE domain